MRSLSHKPTFKGLDLTRGVLDGAITYPWERCAEGPTKSDKRWCFYPTERADAEWVRQSIPTERVFEKSVEAQIVEWADDVAYSIHDVEDWYRAGFMPLELIVQSDEARAALAERIAPEVADDNFTRDQAFEEIKRFFNPAGGPFQGIRSGYDGSAKTKEGLRALRSALFDEFIECVSLTDHSKPATRHNNDLEIAPLARLRGAILKELLTEYVLKHPRMATCEAGQSRVIRDLVVNFAGVLDFDKATMQLGAKPRLTIFPADMQQDLIRAKANPPELLRLIADHVSRHDRRLRNPTSRPTHRGRHR